MNLQTVPAHVRRTGYRCSGSIDHTVHEVLETKTHWGRGTAGGATVDMGIYELNTCVAMDATTGSTPMSRNAGRKQAASGPIALTPAVRAAISARAR